MSQERHLKIERTFTHNPLDQQILVMENETKGQIVAKISFDWQTPLPLINEIANAINKQNIVLKSPVK
jgi:hypothetical protein